MFLNVFFTVISLGLLRIAHLSYGKHWGPFAACVLFAVMFLGMVIYSVLDELAWSHDWKWWQKHVRCRLGEHGWDDPVPGELILWQCRVCGRKFQKANRRKWWGG